MPNYTLFWIVLLVAYLMVTGRMEDLIDLLRSGQPVTGPTGQEGAPAQTPDNPNNPKVG